MVGYGSIGKRHIENLSKLPNVEIIVCTKQRYDNFLKTKKCKKIIDLQKAINENPSAAIICNETSYHIKTAIKLANAGIHIFIEKPLSNSLTNLKKLFDLTQRKKIIVQVGNVLHFHPCIKKIKLILIQKDLGKILSVYAENGSYLPDWHPYENYQKSYASKKELGGGVILTCIHEIDYLYWLFGKIDETTAYVKKISDLKITVEDIGAILFLFKNNIIGQVHLDYFQKPPSRICKIIGTKGILICDINSNSVKIYNMKTKKWNEKIKMEKYNINKMYIDELKHFIYCVQHNLKEHNNIKQGIDVLKIALAVKKSARNKKKVKI